MSYLMHVCICFNLGVVLVISCSYFECVYACVSLLKGYDSLVLFKVRRRGAHLLSFESIDGYATTFVTHGQCDARPTVVALGVFVAAEQLTFGWYQVTLLGGRNTVSEISNVFSCEYKKNERPISKFMYICKS